MKRITAALVRAAPAPSITWDSATKGLCLRVSKNGVRTFCLKYRIDGRERQVKIGNWPTWSVDAARAEAKELRRVIDQGHDPAEHLPTLRVKLRDLPYMQRKIQYRTTAERKVLDEIAQHLGRHTKVTDIHGGDIKQMHTALTRDHGPVMANRMLGICSRMFSLSLVPVAGENKPWRNAEQGNPCKGIARNHEESRERFFSQSELAAIAAALDAYGNDVRSEAAVNAIRLVMLTGCRPQEARLAQWSQFDEPGFWVKPSAHMKTNRTHRLPLSPGAVELIGRWRKRRKTDAVWVFPGQKRGEPLATLEHPWKFVRQHAGLAPTDRLYDLRHSFASIGAGGGLSLPIIGRLLGHTNPRTTARYAHLADDPLREAADRIGAVIHGATNGGGAEVVRIPRKG
jgi:integrase